MVIEFRVLERGRFSTYEFWGYRESGMVEGPNTWSAKIMWYLCVECASITMVLESNTTCHGRTAPAPVFFVVDGDDDGFCGFCGPSRTGSPAAFLSAFHLAQAGVPAAFMRSLKMVDDHLSSITKLFFDPSSENLSTFSDENWNQQELTELHG